MIDIKIVQVYRPMKSTYHCIGGCMGNPRHHVERTWASDIKKG